MTKSKRNLNYDSRNFDVGNAGIEKKCSCKQSKNRLKKKIGNYFWTHYINILTLNTVDLNPIFILNQN